MNKRLLAVAGLVAGLLCLAAFAFHFAPSIQDGAPLTAATWLGDQQGVPARYLGQLLPDLTTCFYGTGSPPCILASAPDIPHPISTWPPESFLNFYSGVFSLSPTESSAGTYPTNTYVAEHWSLGQYIGPADYHEAGCDGGEGGGCYSEYWDCNGRSPTPPDTQVSLYGTDCWGEHLVPEYPPAGGVNPSEPGQTAYTVSTYTRFIPDRSLGAPTQSCNTNDPPDCTDVCPAPTVTGDEVIIYNQQCWEGKSNPPPYVIHRDEKLQGAVPLVMPGDPLTAQWSCLPSHTVIYRYRDCSWYPIIGWVCSNYHTPTEYSIDPLFTGASSPDFSASALRGKSTITAPQRPGLYTYSLTCQGPKPLTLSVSFKVKNTTGITCKVAPISTLGIGTGVRLTHNSTLEVKATVEGKAYDFCIDNKTNLDFFVPLKTQAEVDKFLSAVDAGLGDGTTLLNQLY